MAAEHDETPRTLCKPGGRMHEFVVDPDDGTVSLVLKGPRRAVHEELRYTADFAREIGEQLLKAAEHADHHARVNALKARAAVLEAEKRRLLAGIDAAGFAACAPYDVPGLPEQAMPS